MTLRIPVVPAAMTVPKIEPTIDIDGTVLDEAFEDRGRNFVDELLWYGRPLRQAIELDCGGRG